MNVDLDKYTRNFRIFYSKLIGNHPQKQVLQKKFKTLLQNQGNKWRSGLFNKGTNNEIKSVKTFLQLAKNTTVADKKANKSKHQWMTQTNNFQTAFVFCCIYSFVQAKSKQGFKALKQTLQNDEILVQGKLLNGLILKKVLVGWTKIQKIFDNTFSVKPYLIVSDVVNEFPQQFTQIIYKKITKGYIDKFQMGQMNESKFNQLVQITKTNINYFELDKNQIKNSRKFGNYKISVNIGYQKDQKKYVVAKQVPTKKKQDIQQQKLFKKFALISQDLSKMYQQTNGKLNSLQSIILAKQSIYKAVGTQLKPSGKTSRIKRSNSIQSQRF